MEGTDPSLLAKRRHQSSSCWCSSSCSRPAHRALLSLLTRRRRRRLRRQQQRRRITHSAHAHLQLRSEQISGGRRQEGSCCEHVSLTIALLPFLPLSLSAADAGADRRSEPLLIIFPADVDCDTRLPVPVSRCKLPCPLTFFLTRLSPPLTAPVTRSHARSRL